jgi:hypothetical protein
MRHVSRAKQAYFRTAALLGAAVLLLATAVPAAAQAPSAGGPSFFKGRVRDLSGSAADLEKRFEAAVRAADGTFFAAARFPASSRVRYGRRDGGDDLYTVSAGASRIKIREKAGDGYSISNGDEEGRNPAPALWLLLCDGKTGRVIDASVLDPERTYEFDSTPVMWLGNSGAAESLAFLDGIFLGHPDDDVREKMLFVLSRHDDPGVYDLLRRTALKDRAGDVRQQAVFWLGTIPDGRSLAGLKEIFRESRQAGIREQVVFALSLRKEKDAVVEMIRIAREDRDDSVRGKAVFWLGQKASAESVKALKDIVSEPTEEDKIKEQAVFAISQLPKNKSVPLLLDIARNHKNPSVRKKAIFWLGQTDDPAALKLFEEILLKK